MKVYRYYKAEHALSLLNDLELRTSLPNALNDPFELSPNIDPAQFTQRRCEAFLRTDYNIDIWYEREGRQRGYTNKKDFKRWYLKDLPRRALTLLPRVPKNVEDARKSFADTFSKNWRMICVSRRYDSTLMWSHYADNHSGVVIELSTAEPSLSQVAQNCILHVCYSQKKADYFHFNKIQKFEKMMFAVAATKAKEWSYEEEVRILIPASSRILRGSRYLPLSSRCITKVYLGCRAQVSTKTAVAAKLKRAHFAHVSIVNAELHPSEYALRFTED